MVQGTEKHRVLPVQHPASVIVSVVSIVFVARFALFDLGTVVRSIKQIPSKRNSVAIFGPDLDLTSTL